MAYNYKGFDTFVLSKLFNKFGIEMFFVKKMKTTLTVQSLQRIVSELRVSPIELARMAHDTRFGNQGIDPTQATAKNFEEYLFEKSSKTKGFPLVPCKEDRDVLTEYMVNPEFVKNIKTLQEVRTCFTSHTKADPKWLETVAPSSKYPDTPLSSETEKTPKGGQSK